MSEVSKSSLSTVRGAKKPRRRRQKQRREELDFPLTGSNTAIPPGLRSALLEQMGLRQEDQIPGEQRRSLIERLPKPLSNQKLQQAIAAMQSDQIEAKNTSWEMTHSAANAAGNLVQRENGGNAPNNGRVIIRQVVYDYYDVRGNTLEEVAAQLDPDEWGRCRANYSYKTRVVDGQVQRADVTLRITIRLPRWRGRGHNRASQEARDEWARMLGSLRTHEEQHAEIARTWAPLIRERLIGVDEAQAETTFNEAGAEAQAEQDQLDADTQHGQTQGVNLDLSIV